MYIPTNNKQTLAINGVNKCRHFTLYGRLVSPIACVLYNLGGFHQLTRLFPTVQTPPAPPWCHWQYAGDVSW